MKTPPTLPALVILLLFCHQQHTFAQESKSIGPKTVYFAVDGLLAIPLSSLKQYSKARGGMRIEVGVPFKATPSLSAGLEFSGIFSPTRNDQFKGLDVNTSTAIISLQPFLRWSSVSDAAVRPFIDFSAGIMAASTSTTSEVVDEATFLEEVLFGAEDEVETTTHESYSSSNFAYSIGAGFTIKKFVRVGVRYSHTNSLDYVDTDKVYVDDSEIRYEVNRIPIDMITITVGFVIGKVH